MRRILNWSARRSGAHLSITGLSPEGEEIRVTHVEFINAALPWPVAEDVDGVEWELVADHATFLPRGRGQGLPAGLELAA